MNRILVTGATGFLGSSLTQRLLREGVSVVAVGRNAAKCAELSAKGADVISHDLVLPLSDAQLAKARGIDAVVHCAALSAPFGPRAAFERQNTLATLNTVEIAARLGVRRFVYISTPAVYFRFSDQFSLPEDAPLPKPINAYAATKRAGEDIALGRPQIGPIVLRPRGIYGKGDTALLPRLARAARAGPLPLLRSGQAQTDITHADDAVEAILAALAAPPSIAGQIFNVSGGMPLAIRTIADAACARLGITPRWQRLPLSLLLPVARLGEAAACVSPAPFEPRITLYGLGLFAYSQTLDITKAERLLSWRPKVSFEDGLRRTFAA